jgi:hypothetical protein
LEETPPATQLVSPKELKLTPVYPPLLLTFLGVRAFTSVFSESTFAFSASSATCVSASSFDLSSKALSCAKMIELKRKRDISKISFLT